MGNLSVLENSKGVSWKFPCPRRVMIIWGNGIIKQFPKLKHEVIS